MITNLVITKTKKACLLKVDIYITTLTLWSQQTMQPLYTVQKFSIALGALF